MGWSDLLLLMTPKRLGLQPPLARAKRNGEEPCPVLWETPIGVFWGRSNDGDLLGAMLIEQLFWGIYQRGAVVIRSGDVVFDAGSHLGTFSRFALNRGARLVVAFEPESTNIACYKQTFQQEIEEGRVILVEAAVWETPGTLSFSDAKLDNSGTGIVRPREDDCPDVKVPATSIDETVSRLNLDRVDFIKMDIEGAERHALRGARRSLARFGPRLAVCTYHRPDDPAVIPEVVFAARPSYQMFSSEEVAYFY